MAQLTIEFFSHCLNRPATFKMLLPNDPRQPDAARDAKPMKTLFLLHGYTGAAYNWVPEFLAEQYHFAIVIPSGENSFWIDGISTAHRFGSFLAEELVDYVRKTFHLAMTAEDTFIMGFSMGGYGALRTALAYPETFGKTIALSSALIVHEVAGMKPGEFNGVANYEYYRECFGEPEKVLASRNNPETLVDEILSEGKKMPGIFMACGTEDFLLKANREMHAFLEGRKVPHHYYESKGNHDMVFWDEYVRKLVPMLFENN